MAVVPPSPCESASAGNAWVRGAGYRGATIATSHPRSRRPLTLRAVTTETPLTWGGYVSVQTSRRGERVMAEGWFGQGASLPDESPAGVTGASRPGHGPATPGASPARRTLVRHLSGTRQAPGRVG